MDCTELSPSESQMLGIYEAQIKSGLTHFLEVGTALMTVRDGKLYRQSHPNFEAYCREKWDIGRDRAEQLCKAASVVESLPTIVGKPKKESQARELSKIDDPAERAEVWEEAVAEASEESDGERQPTAKKIKEVAAKRQKPNAAPRPQRSPVFGKISHDTRTAAKLFATTAQDNDISNELYARLIDWCDEYDKYVKEFETI